MMRTGRADRLWAIGGALGAVILFAIGWLFFIGPQYHQASSLQDQAAAAELRLTPLEHRLVELRQQNGNLERYRAQLARDRQALPTTSGLSDFLRAMQTSGSSTGVSVSGVIVGALTEVPVTGAQIYAFPITLVATGAAANLDQFLDQLQRVQLRAVLISSVNAVPGGQSGSLAGTVTLTLSVQAFVAGTDGAGDAEPSTKTN
jgi:Tfp pilus assembly protein PilO